MSRILQELVGGLAKGIFAIGPRVSTASIVTLALCLACAAPGAIEAEEGNFIGLFGGVWSGSGTVVNEAKPWHVNCRAIGDAGTDHLVIKGSCNVFLASFSIAADVTFDPSSGRYSGTYTGGDMTAHISGKRRGDAVDFVMTWAKPKNGDLRARLTIVNSGNGDLRIIVDNLKSNGPEERTSDLLLTQS